MDNGGKDWLRRGGPEVRYRLSGLWVCTSFTVLDAANPPSAKCSLRPAQWYTPLPPPLPQPCKPAEKGMKHHLRSMAGILHPGPVGTSWFGVPGENTPVLDSIAVSFWVLLCRCRLKKLLMIKERQK